MARLIRRRRGDNTQRHWMTLEAEPATVGRSYLIAASYGGIETFDVAFYNGRRRDGAHWWTLGNIEIDPSCINFYAEIVPPVLAESRP